MSDQPKPDLAAARAAAAAAVTENYSLPKRKAPIFKVSLESNDSRDSIFKLSMDGKHILTWSVIEFAAVVHMLDMLGNANNFNTDAELPPGDRADPIISEVILLPNAMLGVFDQFGEQMPDYQGRFAEMIEKVRAAAPESTNWHECKITSADPPTSPAALSVVGNLPSAATGISITGELPTEEKS